MKSVFVTKNNSEIQLFIQLLSEKGIACYGESLLQFEVLPNLPTDIATDWIFFTSPNAVKLYKDAYPSCTKLWAALGIGTAKGNEHLFRFIGSGTDLNSIAQNFGVEPNSHSVTLITPLDGNKSILPFLHEKTKVLTLYKTLEIPKILPQAAAYIFTSPSNVRAAADANDISSMHVACLGDSTYQQLQAVGAKNILVFKTWVWQEMVSEVEDWLANL
jgi:uroporphyrinogen-III synthase